MGRARRLTRASCTVSALRGGCGAVPETKTPRRYLSACTAGRRSVILEGEALVPRRCHEGDGSV